MIRELINLEPTGDPFADTGAMVIEYLQEKNPEKSIMQLIEMATDIYVKQWNNNLYMFFFNSTITHNTCIGEAGIKNTKKYFQSLFDNVNAVNGFCRVSGMEGKVFVGGRHNQIMVGSRTLINFHHGFEDGIFVSRDIIIRNFFVPLGIELLGDKVALITCNSNKVEKYILHKIMDRLFKDIGSNISKSIQRSEFSNPSNALFEYASQSIENIKNSTLISEESGKSETKGINLNLFHFTNYKDKATINLFTLPATVFGFYKYCIEKHKEQWSSFVHGNYRKYESYNANYDTETETYREKVNEFVVIPKHKVKELQDFDNLNFSLANAGEKIVEEKIKGGKKGEATKIECFIFNKNEFEGWKQGKLYKEWKKEFNGFEIGNKIIKEATVLVYKKEAFTKKWMNLIYEKLLKEKSLLNNILEWNKKIPFDFKITKLYQINLRNMNKETLKQIEVIAETIISDEDNIKRSINKLKTSKYSELRSFIIKLIEKNYKAGNPMLISMNDYVKYLFPEDRNWSEIRDLLLICIYQRLHEKGFEIPDDGTEDTNIDEVPVVD
jgi:hypothetical protein